MQQKRKKIGVDIDDTLLGFVTGLVAFHNQVYGTELERHHYTDFDLSRVWGCPSAEVNERVIAFIESPSHREIQPLEGAQEALAELSIIYDPVAITARGHHHAHLANELIDLHFPSVFSEIHFLGHHAPVHGTVRPRSKGEVCAELEVDFMVEDGLHNAVSVSEQGIRVFLMDQPWNQGPLPRHTIRVFGWKHLMSLLRN